MAWPDWSWPPFFLWQIYATVQQQLAFDTALIYCIVDITIITIYDHIKARTYSYDCNVLSLRKNKKMHGIY